MTIIRPEVTGRSGLSAIRLPELSALDLERHVSVPEAAEHLIRKVSPRREAVRLRDLLTEAST